MASTVDAVFELISGALTTRREGRHSGFGNFDARQVAERMARTPHGGVGLVPAGPAARFKASRNLRTKSAADRLRHTSQMQRAHHPVALCMSGPLAGGPAVC